MPRKRRGRKKKKWGKGKGKGDSGGGKRAMWLESCDEPAHLKHFETYYKAQGVVPPEEWDAFVKCLRTKLPVSFRISPACPNKTQLTKELRTTFTFGDRVIELPDGYKVPAPRPLKWMGGERAWQIDCSKTQLKQSPLLKLFKSFLRQEQEAGNITRQEAVSMIPPALLECKPGHVVLDMCASPGSKTTQIMEDMMRVRLSSESPARPIDENSLIVANDVDTKRAYMLVHQCKRLCSPMICVTTHAGQDFPALSAKMPGRSGGREPVFDRILCDVPCSGDGTARKDPLVLHKWDTLGGIGLHRLQIQIAMRGVQLLKVGGIMVYSTCTFNPLENEAVVSEIISRCGGGLEIVDVSEKLPGLVRGPGIKTWKVFGTVRGGHFTQFDSPKDVPLDNQRLQHLFHKTMWPRPRAELDAMGLERCLRLLPHKQNTGGFFVAVLRKKTSIPNACFRDDVKASLLKYECGLEPRPKEVRAASERETNEGETTNASRRRPRESDVDVVSEQERKRLKSRSDNDDVSAPATKASEEEGTSAAPTKERPKKATNLELNFVHRFPKQDWQNICAEFGIGADDERRLGNLVFSRGVDKKACQIVTPAMERLCISRQMGIKALAPLAFPSFVPAGLKIVHPGVKIFQRRRKPDDTRPEYRATQQGLDLILPYITKRIVPISMKEMMHVLSNPGVLLSLETDFSDASRALIGAEKNGSVVLTLRASDMTELQKRYPTLRHVACTGWKGHKTMNPMMRKDDAACLLQILRPPAEKYPGLTEALASEDTRVAKMLADRATETKTVSAAASSESTGAAEDGASTSA